MSAPKRWIDDAGSATPFERDLLRSAASIEPPPGAQGEVWAAVLARLPPPGAPGGHDGGSGPQAPGGGASAAGKAAAAAKGASGAGAGGSVATFAAGGAGILKSALIGAGSAVALLTAYSVVVPPDRPEVPPNASAALATPEAVQRRAPPLGGPAAPVPQATATEAPTASASADRARPAVITSNAADTPPAATARAEAPAAATERETMTREESRQVSEARDALRRGDAAGALSLLEQIRARFPGGVLVQEREALAIEALVRSGRRADASARAAAFLAAYPTSTLAERVQTLVK